MTNPRGPNDFPPTDKELEDYYGKPVTEYERMDAIRRQSEAFDRFDLSEIVLDRADEIMAILLDKRADGSIICAILEEERDKVIARRASMELYGKPDVIKASEIQS